MPRFPQGDMCKVTYLCDVASQKCDYERILMDEARSHQP